MLLVAAQVGGLLATDWGFLDQKLCLWIGVAALAGLACARRPWLAWVALLAGVGAVAAFPLARRLAEARPQHVSAHGFAVIEGRVAKVERGRSRWSLVLDGVERRDPGAPLPRRVGVASGARDEISPLSRARRGDRLRLRVAFRAPDPRRNPGGRDRRHELARRGIGALGWLAPPHSAVRLRGGAEGSSPRPPSALLAAVRERAAAELIERGPGGALLAALALGQRRGLAEADIAAFRHLGVGHLLAVSGLHLALVAALAYRMALFALTRRPPAAVDLRRGAVLFAAAAAFCYSQLAGGAVPVLRSLLLFALLALGWWLRRPLGRDVSLAWAALAILAASPEALFDPGAQLSFAACGALLAAPPPAARGEGPRHAAERGLRLSAAALAATAPIAARSFGLLSPWAIPANFIAVPWTALILLPSALVAAATAAFDPPGSEWVLSLTCAAADATLRLFSLATAWLPGPWRCAPSAAATFVAAAAAVLVIRARCTRWRIAGALALTAGLAYAPPDAHAPPVPRAVFLDVGQGDATLVQGRSAALLIDGGSAVPGSHDRGARDVVPALLALGVRQLDLVVVSHSDLDHRGGIASVLEAMPVSALWLPFGASQQVAFAELLERARARGIPTWERGLGSPAERFGDLRCVPLWPEPGLAALSHPRELSPNDASLVVRIDVAGRRLLLPGDIEGGAERRLLQEHGTALRAEILKLPHHGSRTSSSAPWLSAVAAEVAVASASRHNRFGMPHPAVRRRVREAGAALWWTGRDGAVWIALDSDPLWVRSTLPSLESASGRHGRDGSAQ